MTIDRDRPQMPDGYGVPDHDEGLLTWQQVRTRLEESKHYWLATVRADGRPHVVPRWGAWVDDRLYYDGAPTTVHVRNIVERPGVTLHLEDGQHAVIVEGESRQAEPPGPELGSRISAAFAAKYPDYQPEPDAWEGEMAGGLCVLTPSTAMAWFDFPTDVTRFTFRPPPT